MVHTETKAVSVSKGKKLTDILPQKDIERVIAEQILRNKSPTPYSQTMQFGVISRPEIDQFASGQIDSSATGDTVLVTGIANKILKVYAFTNYKVAGTTQAWRVEIDTGVSFGTTRVISATNTSDKENLGQMYILESTERLVVNVTTAVAASTIDWTVHYAEIGFGTVWS